LGAAVGAADDPVADRLLASGRSVRGGSTWPSTHDDYRLLASGVDSRTVMGRAGHSSETTTMTVYAKVRPAVDSAAAELWGRLLQEEMFELRGNT